MADRREKAEYGRLERTVGMVEKKIVDWIGKTVRETGSEEGRK